MIPPAPYLFKSARRNVLQAKRRTTIAYQSAHLKNDRMHALYMSRLADLAWGYAAMDVVRLLLGGGA